MTCHCSDLTIQINELIHDCLEVLKLTDLAIYQQAVIVRHELFVKQFCQNEFLQWQARNFEDIKRRNPKILILQSHSEILKIIWKLLHSATKTRVWTFLEKNWVCEDHT